MVRSRRPSCFALALLGGSLVHGAAPQFHASLSPDRVQAGNEILLTITATWEGDSSQCLLGEVLLETPADLERGSLQPASGEIAFRQGSPVSTFSYLCRLKPLKEGEFTLDKLEVKFRTPETQTEDWETWKPSSPLSFHATRARFSSPDLLIPAAVLAGVLLVGVSIFVAVSLRQRRASVTEEAIDLEALALERLADLRKLRIKGDYKAFFAQLDALIRDYAEKKYGLKPVADAGLLSAIEQNLDGPIAQRLRETLKLAEDVRFGGAPPLPAELDRAQKTVKEILERYQASRPRKNPEDEIALR